jgi:hypothetical protein
VAFFVVVHHRRDREQPWVNHWDGNELLQSITTTTAIAARCQRAKENAERVYVHRCGWAGGGPMVCCSVLVRAAGRDDNIGWVRFTDALVLDADPVVEPARGQESYYADAPPSRLTEARQ